MKRVLVALAVAAIFASASPAAIRAEGALNYDDHRVTVYCQSEEGPFTLAQLHSSEVFGELASADVWLGDDPPTWSGATDSVDLVEGVEVVLSATLSFVDAGGNEAGTGTLVATMTPLGDPATTLGEDVGNRTSHSVRTAQFVEGSGLLTLPDLSQVALFCFGEVVDESVLETDPHTFVAGASGVHLNCSWEFDDGFAAFSAIERSDELDVFAGLLSAEHLLLSEGPAIGSLDAAGVTISLDMVDIDTGDTYGAQANADFTSVGEPVTSFLVSETGLMKVVLQALSVGGSFDVSTGDSFPMDDEHCEASRSRTQRIETEPSGPKPAPAPLNDAPEGAIELTIGDRVRVNTTGAVVESEVFAFCIGGAAIPEPAHTVWYTIEGTGGDVTVDTAGTRFDTVVAVYVVEGGEFVQVACVNDIFGPPGSLQAAVTFPTEEHVTYWIQAGGCDSWTGDCVAESGWLQLEVR